MENFILFSSIIMLYLTFFICGKYRFFLSFWQTFSDKTWCPDRDWRMIIKSMRELMQNRDDAQSVDWHLRHCREFQNDSLLQQLIFCRFQNSSVMKIWKCLFYSNGSKSSPFSQTRGETKREIHGNMDPFCI